MSEYRVREIGIVFNIQIKQIVKGKRKGLFLKRKSEVIWSSTNKSGNPMTVHDAFKGNFEEFKSLFEAIARITQLKEEATYHYPSSNRHPSQWERQGKGCDKTV